MTELLSEMTEVLSESAVRRRSSKLVLLKISQNSLGNACTTVSLFNNVVFSCEFSKIFKNTHF